MDDAELLWAGTIGHRVQKHERALVSSSGALPNAPHMRVKAPVSASKTATRWFPYPSATNSSFVGE